MLLADNSGQGRAPRRPMLDVCLSTSIGPTHKTTEPLLDIHLSPPEWLANSADLPLQGTELLQRGKGDPCRSGPLRNKVDSNGCNFAFALSYVDDDCQNFVR